MANSMFHCFVPFAVRYYTGEAFIPAGYAAKMAGLLSQVPPEHRLLSWNIDGLDDVGGVEALVQRVLSIAEDVAKWRPLAVLLQEVVPLAVELLSSDRVLGSTYEVVIPEDPPFPYHVAILLDKKRLRKRSAPRTLPFESSQMGRQVLCVRVGLSSHPEAGPIMLATAHLESTKKSAPERKRQLLQSLQYLWRQHQLMLDKGISSLVLLGGDLNIRDQEMMAVHKELGDQAFSYCDVWHFCGSPNGEQYTWDTTENTNLHAAFASKMRFDRILFISSGVSDVYGSPGLDGVKKDSQSTVKSTEHGWRPKSIQLLGKEKVRTLGRFPSDHWGLLTEWTYT